MEREEMLQVRLAILAMQTGTPQTGPHRLTRRPVWQPVSAEAYPTALRLDARFVADPARKDGKPARQLPDYKAKFLTAVDGGAQLYRRMVSAAHQIAKDVHAQDSLLAARHQIALTEGLRTIDEQLRSDRVGLRSGRDRLRWRLRSEAAMLRAQIASGAAVAHARLNAKRTLYQQQITQMEARGRGIVATANQHVADVSTQANAARAALESYKSGIDNEFGLNNSELLVNVRNEAIRTYLPPRVELQRGNIEAQRSRVVEAMTSSFACLQCNVDSAALSFTQAVAAVEQPAHRAIDAAADGGRKSVQDTYDQLHAVVEEGYHHTDRSMVEQHRSARTSVIDLAQQQSDAERAELANSSARQIGALTSAATGQVQGIRRLKALLERETSLTEPALAGIVQRAGERFISNAALVGAQHPATTLRMARASAAERASRAEASDGQLALLAAQGRALVDRALERGLVSVAREVVRTWTPIHAVPDQVRDSANASLEPLDDAFFNGLAGFRDALASVSAGVDSVYFGIPVPTLTPSERRPPRRSGANATPAPTPTPAPRAEGCENCPPPAPAPTSSTLTSEPPQLCSMLDPAAPNMSMLTNPGGAAVASEPNSSPAPAANSPYRFVEDNRTLAGNPGGFQSFAAFVSGAQARVNQTIDTRVEALHSQISWSSTNRAGIMQQLTGLTALQGDAIEAKYDRDYDPNLRQMLRNQIWSGWSADSTNDANINEALFALDGRASDSGFSALTAAFNYTNEYARARLTLLNMTPQQIADMRAAHPAELADFASQLEGRERQVFEALIAGNPALARAIELRGSIDANNYKVPEARAFANADAVDAALRGSGGEAGLAIFAGSRGVDIFGFEDAGVAAARLDESNTAMISDFESLPGVAELSGATASTGRGSTLIAYATRTVDYNMDWYRLHPPPPGSAAEAHMRRLQANPHPYGRHEMAPFHANMIEQSVLHGPDSDEAKAARFYAESRRRGHNPNLESLDSAVHMGMGDAQLGGGYDAEARRLGLEEANRRRAHMFLLADRFRHQFEGGDPPAATAAEAQARMRARFVTSYPRDEHARAVVLGMIDSEAGDMEAVVEHAARTENSELLLKYLGRRDRREIESFTASYNARHSIPLERRLGIFEHHGALGTVFDGDRANALTLAWKGVPQDTKERSEVALLRTQIAIDQSGFLGRLLAGRQYDALEANAAALRRAMGVTAAQVDGRGNIRSYETLTGVRVNYGHFDEHGELRQEYRGDSNPLEVAIGMSQMHVDNYNAATDRIANFLVMALVIGAALITTFLTGGAADSIWLPMLITAGAGLAGIGLSAAIKGGRYGRDDLVRDLAMTVVTTLTAGLGSAGGLFARGAATGGMRGGVAAVRLVARRGVAQAFRIGEPALERAMGRLGVRMAASGHWGADIAIGALSGAANSAVGAAFDPNNRGEGYWNNVWSAAGRGLVGGGLGAGVTRGAMAAVGRAGQGVAGVLGQRSANAALRAGMSNEEALTRSLLTLRRVNYVSGAAARALATGSGNAASRMGELGLDPNMTADQVFSEARTAFVQGLVQGALEHIVDPANRNPFRARNAAVTSEQLSGMTSHQRNEYHQMVLQSLDHIRNAARPVTETSGTEPPAVQPTAVTEAHPAGPEATTVAPKPDAASDTLSPAAPTELPPHLATPATEVDALHGVLQPDAGSGSAGVGPKGHEDAGQPDGSTRIRSTTADGETTQRVNRSELETRYRRGVNVADLVPGELPKGTFIGPDSVLVASDPTNPLLAARNYLALMENHRGMEVLLAFNPDNGHYMVVQGEPQATTKPADIVSRYGAGPPPLSPGYETIRHSHPEKAVTDPIVRIASVLPSGVDGDIGVAVSELDARVARALQRGTSPEEVAAIPHRLEGEIDNLVNGQVHTTRYEITRTGDNYSITVTINPPIDGVVGVGPITGRRSVMLYEYARAGSKLTEDRYSFGLELVADEVLGTGPMRSATQDSGSERAGVMAAARSMEQAAGFDAQVRGTAARGVLDPVLGRSAARSDAYAAVRQLGLIGQPDSLRTLTRLLNDPALTPQSRSLLADAVLQATRIEMIRNGTLAPGDDVVLLFRGVSAERMDDYRREGILLSRIGDDGRNEDAGRGLYGSQDMQSAMNYMGESGGTLLPLIARRSDLGNVIDVRSGAVMQGVPMGDRWLAFVRDNRGSASVRPRGDMDHLRGALFPGIDVPYDLERAGRGRRYEDFLRTIADDASLPAELRAAARDPHLTLMDLGGIASTGNDRGILTDQWAMHSQHIADMFNAAHGFPVAAGDARIGGAIRSVVGPDGDEVALPPAKAAASEEEVATLTKPAVAADDDEYGPLLRAMAQGPTEQETAFLHALDEVHAEAPPPPPATLDAALHQASHAQRMAWFKSAADAFAAAYPKDYAEFMALAGENSWRARAILGLSPGDVRDGHIHHFYSWLTFQGHSHDDAMLLVKRAITLASNAQPRFALLHRHIIERAIWADRLASLPVPLRLMAEQSNLVLYLAAHHAPLLQTIHADFLLRPGATPANSTPADFEAFVANALRLHPAVQAETKGRRILHFTTEADFNAAAKASTPFTRYEYKNLAYTTDERGRVSVAEGVPVRVTGHRSSSALQTEIGNKGYTTDVGFHLIAHIFGAVVNELTVVPGNGKRIAGDPDPNLNGSAYKVEFENIVRNILDTTDDVVEIEVVSVYDSGNTGIRPDRFQVRFRTNAGTWKTATFVNKH